MNTNVHVEKIQNIVKDLEAVSSQDIRSIPERVFREVFLPMFAGKENLLYPASTRIWANIAGGYFSQVNVVNEQNEILFTVPPLLNINAVNPVSSEEIPISHVLETAKQYALIHPVQGSLYLEDQLTKRSLLMRAPNNVLEDIETWNKIFERYGYPIITEVKDLEQKTNPDARDGDVMDYDFVML